MCFMIFLNEKMHSGAIKLRSLKRRKIEFFFIWVSSWFGAKIGILPCQKRLFRYNFGQKRRFGREEN